MPDEAIEALRYAKMRRCEGQGGFAGGTRKVACQGVRAYQVYRGCSPLRGVAVTCSLERYLLHCSSAHTTTEDRLPPAYVRMSTEVNRPSVSWGFIVCSIMHLPPTSAGIGSWVWSDGSRCSWMCHLIISPPVHLPLSIPRVPSIYLGVARADGQTWCEGLQVTAGYSG